jgi:hypothetical protein
MDYNFRAMLIPVNLEDPNGDVEFFKEYPCILLDFKLINPFY